MDRDDRLRQTVSNRYAMHKYEIIIYWSSDDQVFVAEVPELPGCSAHGETHNATLENINDAVELWIETAREFGESIPEPKGERLIPRDHCFELRVLEPEEGW